MHDEWKLMKEVPPLNERLLLLFSRPLVGTVSGHRGARIMVGTAYSFGNYYDGNRKVRRQNPTHWMRLPDELADSPAGQSTEGGK